MQMLANDEQNESPLYLPMKKSHIIGRYFTCQLVAKALGRNFVWQKWLLIWALKDH